MNQQDKENQIRKLRADFRAAKLKDRKKIFLAAFEENLGNVSATCRLFAMDRQTYYNWYNQDPKFKEAADLVTEVAIDFVESKLMNNIKDGKEASAIFYLKSKAKHRGYVEQIQNINTNVDRNDLNELSNEELLAIINRKV